MGECWFLGSSCGIGSAAIMLLLLLGRQWRCCARHKVGTWEGKTLTVTTASKEKLRGAGGYHFWNCTKVIFICI